MTGSPSQQVVSAVSSDCAPVFIVGMNGSGTTMLLDCLSNHSGLYGFPRETRLIPHLISVIGHYEPLEDDQNFKRLWLYTARLTPFRLANDGASMPLPLDWENCARNLAGMLDMLLRCFAKRAGKTRWCEKTPHYAQHMPKLAALFPGARFVHVVRDGRDCASSFHRRWRRSPELTITRWKQLVRCAREQSESLGGRYMEVRYEDLTQTPELWMSRICAFLDLPFEPEVLVSSQPYLSKRSDGVPGLQPNSGRWQQYFSERQTRRLERIAGLLLAEHGYSTTLPESDEIPAAWRRYCWIAADAVRQQIREISLKLRGRIARPWWSILTRPINAYRQSKENLY